MCTVLLFRMFVFTLCGRASGAAWILANELQALTALLLLLLFSFSFFFLLWLRSLAFDWHRSIYWPPMPSCSCPTRSCSFGKLIKCAAAYWKVSGISFHDLNYLTHSVRLHLSRKQAVLRTHKQKNASKESEKKNMRLPSAVHRACKWWRDKT